MTQPFVYDACSFADDLADAYGLRTYSTANGGYTPFAYHVGSV